MYNESCMLFTKVLKKKLLVLSKYIRVQNSYVQVYIKYTGDEGAEAIETSPVYFM